MKKTPDDKVVDFPIHKIKIQPQASSSSSGEKVSFALEQKKVLFSASLLSVLVVLSLTTNHGLNGTSITIANSDVSSGRGIASVSGVSSGGWKKALVQEIASRSELEDSATFLGASPSLEDQLVFQDLAGFYLVRIDSGQLLEITRNAKLSLGDQVKEFNISGFVKEYRRLLPEFDRLEEVDKELHQEAHKKTYVLSLNGQKQKKVSVHLDLDGRLNQLSVY